MRTAHCQIRLFAGVWRVARYLYFIRLFMFYVRVSGQIRNIAPRGIVCLEILCSSEVKYFILNAYIYIYMYI